jgi:type IV fimbrial biogenesis protein FimT
VAALVIHSIRFVDSTTSTLFPNRHHKAALSTSSHSKSGTTLEMQSFHRNVTETEIVREASMKQEGHTLMELMVGLAVTGIISALAIPNFLTLNSGVQIHSAAEEVASELRLARQLAITHRDRVRITFDLEQQALVSQIVNGSEATLHHVYRYADKGVAIEEPSAGPEILFHPSGRSATATTIYLRNKEGQTQTLTVGLTGRVSIL